MTLTEWVLGRFRLELPTEPIFDGPRTGRTFDGVSVAPEVKRCIVVHTVGPTHDGITDVPRLDISRARLIVHTFATTRREIDARRAAVWRSIRYRVPTVDGWSWGFPAHPVAEMDDPDTTLVDPVLHAIDEYTYSGLET